MCIRDSLANRAAVDYTGATGAAYTGEAGAGVPIAPDLAIAKSAAPDPVVAGTALHYTCLLYTSRCV